MSQVTKTEYIIVIKFFTKDELTLKIIKERLNLVVKEQTKPIRMGQKSLEDDARPNRTMEVITKRKVISNGRAGSK